MSNTDYLQVRLPKIFQPFECNQLIRLGKNNDGGYLVNSHDVDKSQILISMGIGSDWSFEKDFSSLNDCKIVCFDESTIVPSNDDFFLGNREFISKNIDLINSNKTISFDEILNCTDKNVFLKCDIEGDEYKLLDKIIECSYKFTSIVIEFHDVFCEKNFNKITNFIAKIDQKLVHLHANNCTSTKTENSYLPYAIEMTFTSSKNLKYNSNLELPNDLDRKNCDWTDYKVIF